MLSGLCFVKNNDLYADFKRGRTDTNDAERSGRPNEAVTPENIKQVLKIVMDDRKLKVREIAKIVNISTASASTILNEKLAMKKVFSKWVPRFLTMEQKQQRAYDSESCLSLFTRNKQDFLHPYVIMDETWIHPMSNIQHPKKGFQHLKIKLRQNSNTILFMKLTASNLLKIKKTKLHLQNMLLQINILSF